MIGRRLLAGCMAAVGKAARSISCCLRKGLGQEGVMDMIFKSATAGTPAFLAPTQTMVDVGQWFRRGRIWLAVSGDDMVLVANGKRPFVEKAPLADVASSFYNPVTGELVFRPSRVFSVDRVKLQPVEAYRVLSAAASKRRRTDHA